MQDLVIPNLKHPAEFANSSPLVGHPQPQRDILFLFRGDVGKARLPHYSRCAPHSPTSHVPLGPAHAHQPHILFLKAMAIPGI